MKLKRVLASVLALVLLVAIMPSALAVPFSLDHSEEAKNDITPATTFPAATYTTTIGPVEFSNVIEVKENHTIIGCDPNSKAMNVKYKGTLVKVYDGACIRTTEDDVDLRICSGGFYRQEQHKNMYAVEGEKYQEYYSTEYRMFRSDYLGPPLYGVKMYPTEKSSFGWKKGLTWQFNEQGLRKDLSSTAIDFEVVTPTQSYLLLIAVMPAPDGGTKEIPGGKELELIEGNSQYKLAMPTTSPMTLNGKTITMGGYNIHNNNFYKLRDVAQILKGTDKQFNVTWDGTAKAINLLPNKAYVSVGGECKAITGTQKVTAIANTATIYKQGAVVQLESYTINDNNYFMLRDLGKAFDFDVTWDATAGCIEIDTSKSYTAE